MAWNILIKFGIHIDVDKLHCQMTYRWLRLCWSLNSKNVLYIEPCGILFGNKKCIYALILTRSNPRHCQMPYFLGWGFALVKILTYETGPNYRTVWIDQTQLVMAVGLGCSNMKGCFFDNWCWNAGRCRIVHLNVCWFVNHNHINGTLSLGFPFLNLN